MSTITASPFTELPPSRDRPLRVEASVVIRQPHGEPVTGAVSVFVLDDGRIGAAFYPDPEHGTVLRWDNGPAAGPRVIHWQAPHCPEDECGSPCGHLGTAEHKED
jgi:hypothetical protein